MPLRLHSSLRDERHAWGAPRDMSSPPNGPQDPRRMKSSKLLPRLSALGSMADPLVSDPARQRRIGTLES